MSRAYLGRAAAEAVGEVVVVRRRRGERLHVQLVALRHALPRRRPRRVAAPRRQRGQAALLQGGGGVIDTTLQCHNYHHPGYSV